MAVVAQLKDGARVSVHEFRQFASECVDFALEEYGELGFYERFGPKAARVAIVGMPA